MDIPPPGEGDANFGMFENYTLGLVILKITNDISPRDEYFQGLLGMD